MRIAARWHAGLAMLLLLCAAPALATLEDEVEEAIELFQIRDPSISRLFEDSVGYVVFPEIKKAGLGVGVARGRGIVFEAGEPVGRARVTQATVGFQAGAQIYAEVIFFETRGALRDFQDGDFELSAQATAVALAEGVSANARYRNGVLIFTVARTGLMYEASVGGQKFSYDPGW